MILILLKPLKIGPLHSLESAIAQAHIIHPFCIDKFNATEAI